MKSESVQGDTFRAQFQDWATTPAEADCSDLLESQLRFQCLGAARVLFPAVVLIVATEKSQDVKGLAFVIGGETLGGDDFAIKAVCVVRETVLCDLVSSKIRLNQIQSLSTRIG